MPASQQKTNTSELAVGLIVDGRYEITGVVGSGGFATVYRAQQMHIHREVALKVLDSKSNKKDETFSERFLREAQVAAKIKHPNVVDIYDFGFVGFNKQPYIAMELLTGHDLAEELSEFGPMAPQRLHRLFRPVLSAISAGHVVGVIHKDLKPANLFLCDPHTPNESLKILDFGVARIDAGELASLTDTGQLLGTPRYIAPEYVTHQLVTPAIDVYQLALIMAECISGVPVVDGNPYTVMMRHCNGDLDIPEALKIGEVGRVFKKALEVDYLERYTNGAEFLVAFDQIAHEFTGNMPIVEWDGPYDREVDQTIKSASIGSPDSAPVGLLHNRSGRAGSSITGPNSGNYRAETTSSPIPIPSNSNLHATVGGRSKLPILAAVFALALLAAGGLLLVALTGNSDEATADGADQVPASADPDPEAKSSPGSQQVKVFVGSDPKGASIFVDGAERGITPQNVTLNSGRAYDVLLVLDGYTDASAVLDLARGDERLFTKLEPLPPPEPKPEEPVVLETEKKTPPVIKAPPTTNGTGNTGKKKVEKTIKKSGGFSVAP